MKIKFLLGVVSLLALCSCQRVVTKQECAATRLTTSYSKELEEKNIYLLGEGGSISDKINYFILQYETVARFNIKEARNIYMETLVGFIESANNYDEIQPFLRDHPFTYKNVELGLGFVDKDGRSCRPIPSPYISYVCLIKGNVLYSIYNEKNRLEVIYREPYEEALRIVYGE